MNSILLSLFLVAAGQTTAPATPLAPSDPAEPATPPQPSSVVPGTPADPAVPPAEPTDVTETAPAAPAPTHTPTPAPSVGGATGGEGGLDLSRPPPPGRAARRASSVPLKTGESVLSTRRLVGISVTLAGGLLSVLGLGAGAATALIHYSSWPESPANDEYPRKSLSVLTAAVCATFLMVGATVVIAGLAATVA